MPDYQDDYPRDSSYSVRSEVLDDFTNVREDHWTTWSWSFEKTTLFEYNFVVRDGPDIDVFVTTDTEYQEFEDGNRFRTMSGLSSVGSTGDRAEESIPVGDYVLVVDNSNYGPTSPPTNFDEDIAEVEMTVVLSQ